MAVWREGGLCQASRGGAGQVPAQFEKEDVRERLRKMPGGPTQPLTVHLRQEIDRLNIVIALTSLTLRNLRLAIAGASCSPPPHPQKPLLGCCRFVLPPSSKPSTPPPPLYDRGSFSSDSAFHLSPRSQRR